MDEYNKYKNKMELAINEKIQNLDEIKEEILKKDNEILDIKNKIKNLELENTQYKNKDENNNEKIDVNLIKIENEKLKNENTNYIRKRRRNKFP